MFCLQARADAFIDDASDSEDHHAARLKAKVLKKSMDEDGYGGSDSEEDEDFNVGDGSDGGEPTDSSGSESGSDADSDEDARPKKKPKGKAKSSPAGKGGKKKKPKAKKDPNEPKRNLSAFMIFSKETRGDVLEKNPGFALGDVGKELGRRWREMDAETKKTFRCQGGGCQGGVRGCHEGVQGGEEGDGGGRRRRQRRRIGIRLSTLSIPPW